MANVVYDYFIAPVGEPTAENATALLQGMKLEALDAEIIWLELGTRKQIPSWSITQEVMQHVHRTPNYKHGVHYYFYRKNRANGAVTRVPRDMFSSFKGDPELAKAKRFAALRQRRLLAAS